jgi:trehalose 6-phosphate synthase
MLPPSKDSPAGYLYDLCQELLAERRLILISNRGPVDYRAGKDGALQLSRGSGGVVTALSAISRYVELTWIASAMGEGDRRVASEHDGSFHVQLPGQKLRLRFVVSPRNVYHKYYNLFCNPLLWFLQHYMWNSPYTPNVDAKVYDAWENGYAAVNRTFAEAAIAEAADDKTPPFVMIHDYQLYLVGGYIRSRLPQAILQHFIHIPWPASSYWHLFPKPMRNAIVESLCAVDIVGLQTKRDVHNFLRTSELFLDGAEVDYETSTISYKGHITKAAPYPVSVDVASLQRHARSPRAQEYEQKLLPHLGEVTIVRVDRTEPSKNIIRGFKSFYTQEVFDLVELINTKYGNDDWKPIEVFFENNYTQAIAGMRLCDVLLVNPVIDGMNLVAKEGPIVSSKDSVLILSEAAGAHDQLGKYAVSVAPADLEGTTRALYEAITMDTSERRQRAAELRRVVEEEDITRWLYAQFQDLRTLACQLPLLLPVLESAPYQPLHSA